MDVVSPNLIDFRKNHVYIARNKADT